MGETGPQHVPEPRPGHSKPVGIWVEAMVWLPMVLPDGSILQLPKFPGTPPQTQQPPTHLQPPPPARSGAGLLAAAPACLEPVAAPAPSGCESALYVNVSFASALMFQLQTTLN